MDFTHFLSSHMLDPSVGGKRLYQSVVEQAIHAEACGYDGVGIPEHHLAVIAASVTMMLGAHRIVRIQTPGRSYSWIAEGRSVHHTSHAPRGGSH